MAIDPVSLGVAAVGGIASMFSKPKAGTTESTPWAPLHEYYKGAEGERRLKEGVEAVYGGSEALPFDEWKRENMSFGPEDQQQAQYQDYLASNPGQKMLNPESDFETVGQTPGILDESQRLYQDGGMTPEQISLNQQHTGSQQDKYNEMYNGGDLDPTNQSQYLYQNMVTGQYDNNPQNVGGSITPQTIQAAQNAFTPDAQAQNWNAETVDPNAVQQMQASQLGSAAQVNAPQVDASRVGNVAQMGAAQMQGAQNLGYTPTGQVADFMNGEAYDNKFLDSQIDAASRKFGQQFNEQIMSGITDNAVGSGALGGSRQGIAEGIAARGAADAMGDMVGGMRSNAYSQGFGAMSGLTSQQMAGGIGQASQNAGLNQNTNANNAGWQQQASGNNMGAKNQQIFQNDQNRTGANMANAGFGMQGGMYNAGANNQFGITQGGWDQQASGANALAGNTFLANNQNATNAARSGNTASNNQFSLTNQNLGFGIAGQNTNIQDKTNTNNVANDMTGQNWNANLTQQDNNQNMAANQQNLQNRAGAFGMLGAGQNVQNNAYNSLMTNYGQPQQQDWQNLNNYSNTINSVNSGQSVTTQQPYNPTANGIGAGMSIYSMLGPQQSQQNYQGQQNPLYNNPAYIKNF